jgi:hypothetical protein
MTGLSRWQAGGELSCASCPMQASGQNGDPACQIALELQQFGEAMTATCCPEAERQAA